MLVGHVALAALIVEQVERVYGCDMDDRDAGRSDMEISVCIVRSVYLLSCLLLSYNSHELTQWLYVCIGMDLKWCGFRVCMYACSAIIRSQLEYYF